MVAGLLLRGFGTFWAQESYGPYLANSYGRKVEVQAVMILFLSVAVHAVTRKQKLAFATEGRQGKEKTLYIYIKNVNISSIKKNLFI